MTQSSKSLVSTVWLAQNLSSSNIVVLDASRHLPAAAREPQAEFEDVHILGARFLDLASLTDKASPVPAALPRPEQVAERLSELGVFAGSQIVLYDDSAIKTSARAWFALTQCGVPNVAILDGGLGKWRAEGRPLERGRVENDPTHMPQLRQPQMVATKQDMLSNLDSAAEQVIDARAPDRVFGAGIDPVHGGQNGRIPGALNVPFDEVFDEDGTYKSPEDLRALFIAAEIDWKQPLITTCGSGMTASVLLFAAHLAGKDDVRLYDGSWQEWEADPDTPKEQGPR